MFRIIIAAIVLVATTGITLADVSDETCEGTKAFCRFATKCPADKCMEDTNLDGKWGCVDCSVAPAAGNLTTGGENPPPPGGRMQMKKAQ